MINNPKTRKQIKGYLIITNILLGFVLFFLLVVGLFIIRSNQINRATELRQQISFDINNLGDKGDNIIPNYIKSDKIANSDDKGKMQIPQNNLLQKNIMTSNKPKIAVIITNLGLNRRATELAISLPQEFALGFLPYTNSLKPLLYKAQERGNEIYIYLPCETDNASDNPGQHALMSNAGTKENILRLNMILSLYMRYNGIYTSYKEEFTLKQEKAEPIIDKIIGRNLIFILGREKNLLTPQYLLDKQNVVVTNIVIDNQLDEEVIKYNLKRLIVNAKKNKVSIGYAGASPLTINILNDWFIKELEKENVELVPMSSVLKETSL